MLFRFLVPLRKPGPPTPHPQPHPGALHDLALRHLSDVIIYNSPLAVATPGILFLNCADFLLKEYTVRILSAPLFLALYAGFIPLLHADMCSNVTFSEASPDPFSENWPPPHTSCLSLSYHSSDVGVYLYSICLPLPEHRLHRADILLVTATAIYHCL